MATSLNESLGFEATQTKNKWHVKVIQSGWGSSGFYSESLLQTYGPSVFKKGTKVFANHPSSSEVQDRPERDIHQLAGKLVSDAIYKEGALYADIQFYSHYAPIIAEMYEDVGLSIHALGNATLGEADGREGPIIESLVEDPLTSVDVVTVAGAGGRFISLLESYKAKEEAINLAESITEGNESMITKEEFEEAIADLKATFVEAIAPLRETVQVLVEAATPTLETEAEVVDEESDATPALDPLDIAEKFNESGLPKLALKRVAEVLRSETNSKSIDDLIEEEKAYAASIRESIAVTEVASVAAETTGVIQEATASNPADEFDAIVSRIAKK
jgi:hypothetical protein